MENPSWKLKRYASCVTTTPSSGGEWKHYDEEKNKLVLSLTESHNLIISHGDQVLESLLLLNAQSWLKGVTKGDSMMVICQIKNENRRFRVQFHGDDAPSAVENCSTCVKRLSTYFFIKGASGTSDSTQPQTEKGVEDEPALNGDVPIATIAQILKGDLKKKLPLAYHNTNLPTDEMGMLIRLCLADSNFPAFVGKVEEEFEGIIKQI